MPSTVRSGAAEPAPATGAGERALIGAGVIAVLRSPSPQHAVAVGTELARRGLGAIEVALTTPDASGAIAALRAEVPEATLIGAGTVTTGAEAATAAEAGAEFLVSPGFEPRLFAAMRAASPVAVPGVLTPSEVIAAYSAGARILKLFPSSAVGVAYLRALLGPFPGLRLIATGGVSPANLGEWIAAGAAAVAIGGPLAPGAEEPAEAARLAGKRAAEALRALDAARDRGARR